MDAAAPKPDTLQLRSYIAVSPQISNLAPRGDQTESKGLEKKSCRIPQTPAFGREGKGRHHGRKPQTRSKGTEMESKDQIVYFLTYSIIFGFEQETKTMLSLDVLQSICSESNPFPFGPGTTPTDSCGLGWLWCSTMTKETWSRTAPVCWRTIIDHWGATSHITEMDILLLAAI
jgi:hypothetical protein